MSSLHGGLVQQGMRAFHGGQRDLPGSRTPAPSVNRIDGDSPLAAASSRACFSCGVSLNCTACWGGSVKCRASLRPAMAGGKARLPITASSDWDK